MFRSASPIVDNNETKPIISLANEDTIRKESTTPPILPEGDGYKSSTVELRKLATTHFRSIKENQNENINKQQDETESKIITKHGLSSSELTELIKLKNKKRTIDCRIILGDSKGNAIKTLIKTLQNERDEENEQNKENEEKIKNFSRRLQVLYKLKPDDSLHWTTLDILVTEKNIKVFYLDAAGDSSNLSSITTGVLACDNTELTYCEGRLQHDHVSCSIFAVDHAFHLSKEKSAHNQFDAIRTPMGCDFLIIDYIQEKKKPTKNTLDELSIKSNIALVQVEKELFFVNKQKKICEYFEDAIDLLPTVSHVAFVRFSDQCYYINKRENTAMSINISSFILQVIDTTLNKQLTENQPKRLTRSEINFIAHLTGYPSKKELENFYVIDPIHLPPVYVKNAQSIRFLNDYLTLHPKATQEKINKKGQTLSNYATAHTIFYKPLNKKVNLSIYEKEIAYKQRLQQKR